MELWTSLHNVIVSKDTAYALDACGGFSEWEIFGLPADDGTGNGVIQSSAE
jgi:hypothetical protein